ncbi:MAG TPA: NIPSNAP family protein [Candidatus Sulfotelmatobacter sp.]|nr:NIPSNAP family protein [Candidatus Sulfotelmatobacter sp.]
MIVEMRIYDLQPGTVPQYEKLCAEALPQRTKASRLGASWHTDIGPLNRIIQVWPYESLAERERIVGSADTGAVWPPAAEGLIVAQESKFLVPAPFSPPLVEAKLGDVYEIRTYTIKTGAIPEMLKRWAPLLEGRLKFSPLAACWYSIVGPLSQFIHVWPYKDVNERNRIRAEAQAAGKWPPATREFLLKMENAIAIPAAFSPLH